jgi:hypothetical protein
MQTVICYVYNSKLEVSSISQCYLCAYLTVYIVKDTCTFTQVQYT